MGVIRFALLCVIAISAGIGSLYFGVPVVIDIMDSTQDYMIQWTTEHITECFTMWG